jgi:3-oxoacyl-[acyl-carrier-protein] synthase-3
MNGRQVYTFAVRALCDIINMLMERNNITFDDITYIVPHQANTRIIAAAAKRLGVPYEKFYVNIHEFANTSAASIPLALDEMLKKDILKRGDLIITVAFGGGLTFAGNLIRW